MDKDGLRVGFIHYFFRWTVQPAMLRRQIARRYSEGEETPIEMLIHAKIRKPDRMSNQEFFGIWKQEATAALEAVKAGIIKNIWKVPGKYEVFLVIEVNSVDQMDEIIHSLPIWKLGYDYIVSSMEWIPLRSYEHWAKQLDELSAE